MPRRSRCSAADATACFGLRGDAATGLPIVWMSAFSLCQRSSDSLKQDSRGLLSMLDVGEGGLLLFAAAFGGERDEAIVGLFVGGGAGFPGLGDYFDVDEAVRA